MPLPGPTHIPPIGEQTDPDKVRVAAVVGGQLASAPARGFGLTADELTAILGLAAGDYPTSDEVAATYPVKTAQTRNRIVNPCFQVSAENGNTAVAAGSYPADQFVTGNTSAATITGQRVQVATPDGSRNRLRLNITVADAAVAAGDLIWMYQNIEGIRIADFGWGAAGARQVVLRFGWKGPAGTYGVSIRNGATNRAWVTNFTTLSNADGTQTIVIPGDVTGTWPTDTSCAMIISWAIMAGATYQQTAGVWAATNCLAASGISNGAAALQSFELYDVGLYLDAPTATGLPPQWQMPDEAQELRDCLRYWQILTNHLVNAGATAPYTTVFRQTMRITPALGGGGAGIAFINANSYSGTIYQTAQAYQTLVLSARM